MSKDIRLSGEALRMKREYFRNWRKKNRDKVRRYNAEYWQKKALLNKKSEVDE